MAHHTRIKAAMRRSPRPQTSAPDTKPVDALYQQAGLTTNPRRPQPRSLRLPRPASPSKFDRAAPEELAPPLPVPRRAPNGVEWLPIPGWDLPWLSAGFSTRQGGLTRAYCAEDEQGPPAEVGELNLGFTPADDRETVLANRRLLAEAVTGDPATPLLALKQFHSNLVVDAIATDAARPAPRRADGQIAAEPGLLLAVQTADCIPVLVADRRQRIVAAFHAGWRGTVKRIVESGVGRMRLLFGSRPQTSSPPSVPAPPPAAIPSAKRYFQNLNRSFPTRANSSTKSIPPTPSKPATPCCFSRTRPRPLSIGPSLHVDLVEANRRQLLACGLSPRNIQVVAGCTQCQGESSFASRLTRTRRPHDGRHRHPQSRENPRSREAPQSRENPPPPAPKKIEFRSVICAAPITPTSACSV